MCELDLVPLTPLSPSIALSLQKLNIKMSEFYSRDPCMSFTPQLNKTLSEACNSLDQIRQAVLPHITALLWKTKTISNQLLLNWWPYVIKDSKTIELLERRISINISLLTSDQTTKVGLLLLSALLHSEDGTAGHLAISGLGQQLP